ncbi:MAG: glutamyl-tRNA reductase [Candidatus Limnocylindria bacterium]
MADGSTLALFSVHQRDAPIDARERFAHELTGVARPDLLVVATCHRVEIAAALPPDADAAAELAERLRVELPPQGTLRTGGDAVLHLLRVACGLDSVVTGEGQILGQLRRAFDTAREAGGLEPSLALLVRRAIELGRELRRTTALGSVRRSLGSLAVDAALEGLTEPQDATVLVVGAGEVGKLALRALARRVGSVSVANRDLARAAELAQIHGATAVALERIDDALSGASAVIAAADTRGAVLTTGLLRARLERGPLTIVDLAVPRSVGPDARALDGLRYVDVDGLSDAAGAQLGPAVLEEIESRCAVAADAIVRELEVRRAAPTIRALHERAEAIRRTQLERALSRLTHLSPRDRQVVESLSEGLAHALMHEPTVRLREAPEREGAARDLFSL